MSALSCGPWTYNRFTKYEELLEGKKPDFLDVDKDGNKKESFKKALGDIKHPTGKKQKFTKDKSDPKVAAGRKAAKEMGLKMNEESLEEGMPPWLKGKDEDKGEKKSPCKKCKDEGKDDCKCDDKKSVKEHIIQSLMDDGLANNPVSAAIIAEHMSPEWQEAILDA